MNPSSPCTRLLAGLAIVLAVGCDAGDGELPAADTLGSFEPGAPRDEVVAALPDGEVAPGARVDEGSLLHGYVFESYLIDPGRVEVLWVHDPDAGLPPTNEELRSVVNPVIFLDGELDGLGWTHYEQRMAEWGLPELWSIPTARMMEGPPAPEVEPPSGDRRPPELGPRRDGGGGAAPGESPEEPPISVPDNPLNSV